MDWGGRRGPKSAVSEVDTAPRRPSTANNSLLGDLVGDVTATKPLPRPRAAKPRPADDGRRWALAYIAHGARDPRFDLLRGICLALMIAANLGGDSWLVAATGGDRSFISAAEGFVFIAGAVLGLTAARGMLADTVRHLVARIWLLYRLAVAITLGFALIAVTLDRLTLWYPLPDGLVAAYGERPDAFVVGALALTVGYHGAEWLILFTLLLALAPLALLACAEGRGWLVPTVSVGFYLAAQLYPEELPLPFATPVSLAAWQLLFFVGLTIGYHRAWLAERLARVRPYWYGYGAMTIIAALTLAILYHQETVPAWLYDPLNVELSRAALTPRRLLPVAIYLQATYLLVTWFWTPLRAALGPFFLSFGRNSLWVYLLHLPLIVPLPQHPLPGRPRSQPWHRRPSRRDRRPLGLDQAARLAQRLGVSRGAADESSRGSWVVSRE